MRYERPMIVKREPVAGLLLEKSEKPQDSDVNLKDNVVPVAWPYEPPAIVEREPVTGLLRDKSEKTKPAPSDVNLKENVVPVRWDG